MQHTHQTLDSLRWYAQMGVDLCVDDTPQEIGAGDWGLGTGEQSTIPASAMTMKETRASSPVPSPQSPAPPSSIADAVAEARRLADVTTTLAELEAAIRTFSGCALKKTATHTVIADGVATSNIMIMGDAPGTEDDRSGRPFSGPNGELLDKMLAAIGLGRSSNVYLSNCLFWRPPGNRQPSADELEICRPLVEKHIALIQPRILVLVGGIAASVLLSDTRGITRLRGQIFSYKNDYMAQEVPVHVLYHPSYLLRQPLAKKQAWADLLALKSKLSS